MQAVKSSGSQIEQLLGKALWRIGLRYRKNDKTIFGKPDFTFKKFKIAIFADSEFWHGKDWDVKKLEHKSNIPFWHGKIEGNIKRDKEVTRKLENDGWVVLRFWGNDIMNSLNHCVEEIEAAIRAKK